MYVQVGLLGMKQEPHPTDKEHSWFNFQSSRTVVCVHVWVAAAVHRKHLCSPTQESSDPAPQDTPPRHCPHAYCV